jgi:hypothetical protein
MGIGAIFPYQPLSVLTATSATKTPTASAQYAQMTTNSIALTVGTWELNCFLQTSASGGAATFTDLLLSIYGANGADSGVAPTLLNATSNLTINSIFPADGIMFFTRASSQDSQRHFLGTVVVTVTATVTVYAVPYAVMTTAANARLITGISGRKLY